MRRSCASALKSPQRTDSSVTIYSIFTHKPFQVGTNLPSEAGRSAPTESLLVLDRVKRIDCLTSLAGYATILHMGIMLMLIPISQYSSYAWVLRQIKNLILMEVPATQGTPFFVQFDFV